MDGVIVRFVARIDDRVLVRCLSSGRDPGIPIRHPSRGLRRYLCRRRPHLRITNAGLPHPPFGPGQRLTGIIERTPSPPCLNRWASIDGRHTQLVEGAVAERDSLLAQVLRQFLTCHARLAIHIVPFRAVRKIPEDERKSRSARLIDNVGKKAFQSRFCPGFPASSFSCHT
jgi:hypothetical protein